MHANHTPDGLLLAPTVEEWERLSPEERERVVASLPTDDPALAPPEGTLHWQTKASAQEVLRRYFDRIGRKVFVASELAVHYPGERVFIPDVLVVLDVEDHDRTKWVVTAEGKGLDFVLEVHVGGERRKDLERHPALFARLGIPEYVVFDRARERLYGFALSAPGQPSYRPMLPQHGILHSGVLGLDLQIIDGRLRFLHADAALPEYPELIARLEQAVSAGEAKREEDQRLLEEEQRLRMEGQRLLDEEQRRREELERRVAELEAELKRRDR